VEGNYLIGVLLMLVVNSSSDQKKTLRFSFVFGVVAPCRDQLRVLVKGTRHLIRSTHSSFD